ncbi:hypothetical protein [Candidatus Mesenet endosymbiont of Phosphuga atrata]|uniref:hypothetical protein n=1 Tax=Candidatus Mesenet endosymbiont of Phosphuga atrata TaxID=3066221 RepID=UPI0030D4C0F6
MRFNLIKGDLLSRLACNGIDDYSTVKVNVSYIEAIDLPTTSYTFTNNNDFVIFGWNYGLKKRILTSSNNKGLYLKLEKTNNEEKLALVNSQDQYYYYYYHNDSINIAISSSIPNKLVGNGYVMTYNITGCHGDYSRFEDSKVLIDPKDIMGDRDINFILDDLRDFPDKKLEIEVGKSFLREPPLNNYKSVNIWSNSYGYTGILNNVIFAYNNNNQELQLFSQALNETKVFNDSLFNYFFIEKSGGSYVGCLSDESGQCKNFYTIIPGSSTYDNSDLHPYYYYMENMYDSFHDMKVNVNFKDFEELKQRIGSLEESIGGLEELTEGYDLDIGESFAKNRNLRRRIRGLEGDINVLRSSIDQIKGGVTKGEKGEQGLPGLPSIPSRNGLEGVPGLPGAPGEKGLDGFQGPEGPRGEPGIDGIPGTPGKNGLDGHPGGQKGDKGEAGGQKGERGIPGVSIQGSPGLSGAPGIDGKGIKGDKGDTGPIGPEGKVGTPGLKGDQGNAGTRGEKGDRGWKGEKGELGLIGKQGDTGKQGLKGDSGTSGKDGSSGTKGNKGDVGPIGPQGSEGKRGWKGEKGEPGLVGKQGDTGPTGTKGPEGKAGLPGKDGKNGNPGMPGPTGASGPRGLDGKIGETGLKGESGKDASAEEVVNKLTTDKLFILKNLMLNATDSNGKTLVEKLANSSDLQTKIAQNLLNNKATIYKILEYRDEGDNLLLEQQIMGSLVDDKDFHREVANSLFYDKNQELVDSLANATGQDGKTLIEKLASDAELMQSVAKELSQNPGKIQGPKGDKGESGLPGEKGNKGDMGITGVKGRVGSHGLKGEPGEKGNTGLHGMDGKLGEKGDRGESGLQGLRGDKGDKGELGVQGSKGEIGLSGIDGQPGIKGEQGLKGEIGIPGVDGLPGEKGNKGDMGITGVKGRAGPHGLKGELGEQGLKGERGDVGLPGADGVNAAVADQFFNEMNQTKIEMQNVQKEVETNKNASESFAKEAQDAKNKTELLHDNVVELKNITQDIAQDAENATRNALKSEKNAEAYSQSTQKDFNSIRDIFCKMEPTDQVCSTSRRKREVKKDYYISSGASKPTSFIFNVINFFYPTVGQDKYRLENKMQELEQAAKAVDAAEIVEEFEKVLQKTAKNCGTQKKNLNFNPIKLQSTIIDKQLLNDERKLLETLLAAAKEACKNCPDKSSSLFESRMRKGLADRLQQRNAIDIKKVSIDNEQPRSFVDNAIVANLSKVYAVDGMPARHLN